MYEVWYRSSYDNILARWADILTGTWPSVCVSVDDLEADSI